MIMWKIINEDKMILNASPTLNDAMKFAKGYDKFVTITNGEMEFVGKFGVDTIKDGKCPDGVDYTWMKRRNM
jgi:hypothetical protein